MAEKNEITKILAIYILHSFWYSHSHYHYYCYCWLLIFCANTHTSNDIAMNIIIIFFSSVFHFRTMMSETQILAAAVVLNTNDYKSPSILLLLRPLIWFQYVCCVLCCERWRASAGVAHVCVYVTVHALCQYMKHANRKWFANLWSFRLKTNNPFFIRIQNTRPNRPNRCYCER